MDNIFSCIPCCRASSSSPTAEISHFKAEIDGNFSEETVDELISHMNHFLKKLKGEQDSMSVAASSARVTAAVSTAGKIHEELAQCIEYNMGKVKRNARKAKRKVMDALDNGTTKLIGEILKESKAFPYVGVAAAVVVFLLDKLDEMGKVDNERLEFLERMWSMAKIINNVRNPEQRDHCRAMFVFVLQMSICIYNKIQAATPFARFLSSHIDAADLVEMEKKFADQHQNLMTDFIVSIRNDIPQVKPPPPMLDMPATYGIKDAIEEVKTRLDMEGKSKKIIVTIYGFGGIGKTTLAEAVTNSLSLSNYKFCRLYLDLKSPKIEPLQAQLLRDVFSKNQIVSNPSEGRTFILEAIRNNQEKKPLYLFIDNALEGSEIESLLPLEAISQLSLEVRILATTRDSSKILPVDGFEDKKYRVGENPSAKEMLCHYAGEEPHSKFANMKEVDEVLEMCGGIPLFIKLAGKKLLKQVDKAKICRQMKSAALGVDNNRILDFVYNQLPPDCQQAFLDIAFFYLGCQRYKLERIYTQDVIKGLEDAALITTTTTTTTKIDPLYTCLSTAERVRMHDRLRERAQELSKGERVSDRSEWEEAIQSVKKLETIKALKLQNVQPEDIKSVNKCGNLTSLSLDLSLKKYKRSREFPRMHMDLSLPACIKVLCITGPAAITIRQWKNLEVLKLKHVNVKGSVKDFGTEGRLEKLIFMELVDFNEEYATSFSISNYPCLRHLRLRGAKLKSFPNKFQVVSSLESLKLEKCDQLIGLESGLWGCSDLSLLSLKGCTMLGNLPQEIGKLQCLEKLDLSGCTNLQTLPETVGGLQHLKILYLSSCSGLKNLPESFGHLSFLEELDMSGCYYLENLCDSFGQLSRLQNLNLSYCGNLERLPESLEGLKCLTRLQLNYCKGLKNLPESFGHISSLEELYMSHCENLENLCDSVGQLSRLQRLNLTGCEKLQNLPESLEGLKCLTRLRLDSCKGLKSLPESFGHISSLEQLVMLHCEGLKSLPESFGHISSLEELDMSSCKNLENLCDSFGQLSRLQRLYLQGCEKLQNLPESLEGLKCLRVLDLDVCKGLKSLPESLGGLQCLRVLYLRGCGGLESLPASFSQLSSLEGLWMGQCSSLEYLCDNFGKLTRLEILELTDCEKLQRLPESFGDLLSLKELSMVNCASIKCSPQSFSRLSSLEKLNMMNCISISGSLEFLGGLSSLRKLILAGCSGLENLPKNLGEFRPYLRVVDVRGCHQLVRNDGLTELLSMPSLLIILHSTNTDSNVLRFVIGNDVHLDHVMEENQSLRKVMKKCDSVAETLLKGKCGGGCMRLEEGEGCMRLVREDAVSSGVAKVVYLNTGWCRHLSDECKSGLQEAVDEGYEVVLVDNGVHRWNRHVAVEGKKLNGEVPWNEEDMEMMKEMMCQVPGGCTRVWTSPFPKNCLLLTMLLYAHSVSWMEEVTMTKGKWEGDGNTFHFEESQSLHHKFDAFRNKEGIEILGSEFKRSMWSGLYGFSSDIMRVNYWLIKRH